MIEFEWSSLLREMSERCPFLRDVLVTTAKCANKNRNHVPPICLCYAILLQQRNRDLNLVQRINTVLLSEGKAKKQSFTQLIERCQKVGFSLSHQSKVNLLDHIATHNNDHVVNEVKQGKKLQGTGDNWDYKIRVHNMRKTEQNRDLHYFASNIIVERVPCEGSSKFAPQRDILTVPNSMFLLDNTETRKLREDFKVIVGRILVDRITSLSFMKLIIPAHIESKYPNEMAQKSTIIPLSMQFKEEKKYDDVVDILSTYENTLEDIYSKAELIEIPKGTKPAAASNVSLSGVASRPDQPGVHAKKT
ncbi:Hypothetical predicted protein [Paramuricea clavata]|uniref:Uncharacterized protein n=1 Tax=Paramuricea clavata TaxID=317549 RepID=A0A7D9J8P7_PARCT|nr:Hypothetical predicted protein [Paramuricea clavata]